MYSKMTWPPLIATLLLHVACGSAFADAANMRASVKLFSGNMTGGPTECYLAAESCDTCQRECQTQAARHFFTDNEPNVHYSNYTRSVDELHRCAKYTTKLRRGLPHWCVNDGTRYFATSEFEPTVSSCTREPRACAKWMAKEAHKNLEDGVWDSENHSYLLAKEMEELVAAQEDLAIEMQRHKRLEEEANEVLKAWNERLLDMAILHLENPEETETKFADPVFLNFSYMKDEEKRMETEVSNYNLYEANNRNKEVRKETLEKIPLFLGSIARLENHVKSKKTETDRYLQEIKVIANRTARLQMAATNIIYETTHSNNLDGEIALLDQELLELYIELKKERALLHDANLNSTFSKLRLVGMMRRLVKEISIGQSECPPSEQFGILHSK
ncbi:unnamed protein product [Agarophyton chilense]